MNSDESSPGITFVVIEAFHLNGLKLVIELKGMLPYPVSSFFKLFLVIFHRHRSILKSTYYRSKTGRYHLYSSTSSSSILPTIILEDGMTSQSRESP